MRRRGLDIPRCQHCVTTTPGTQPRKGERHEANCPLCCSSVLLPELSSTGTSPRLCVKDQCCLVQEIPSTGTALFMSAATGGIVFSVSRIIMVQLPAFKDPAGGGKIKTWTDLWRSAGFSTITLYVCALRCRKIDMTCATSCRAENDGHHGLSASLVRRCRRCEALL